MFSVRVSDDQYLRAAELAGVPSWSLIPTDDAEVQSLRLDVEVVLLKALRVGLRVLKARAEEKAGRTIDGYSHAALAALCGDPGTACDSCERIVDTVRTGGVLRLSGDELEFICNECARLPVEH